MPACVLKDAMQRTCPRTTFNLLPSHRRRLALCSAVRAVRALPIAMHRAATRCRARAQLRARPPAAASGAPARRSRRWRCAVLDRAARVAGPRGAPAARAALARARGGQQGLVPQLERPERAAAARARQDLHAIYFYFFLLIFRPCDTSQALTRPNAGCVLEPAARSGDRQAARITDGAPAQGRARAARARACSGCPSRCGARRTRPRGVASCSAARFSRCCHRWIV